MGPGVWYAYDVAKERTKKMTTTATRPSAEHWTALADAERAERLRSQAESDTDGFLSQWAAGRMESRYRYLARVAERGYVVEWSGVADLDGNVLDAEQGRDRYGNLEWTFVRDGRRQWFHPSKARKAATAQANDAKKGYQLCWYRTEVEVQEVRGMPELVEVGPKTYLRPDYRDWA